MPWYQSPAAPQGSASPFHGPHKVSPHWLLGAQSLTAMDTELDQQMLKIPFEAFPCSAARALSSLISVS